MLLTRLSSIIVLLVGLCLLGYGACNSVNIIPFVHHVEQAHARIIRSVPTWVRHDTRLYILTLSYTDKEGVTHEVTPPIHDEWKRQKGESVMIYYNSQDPQEVILDTWSSLYAPTAFPALSGLAFLAVGCLLWRDCNKSKRQKPHHSRKTMPRGTQQK